MFLIFAASCSKDSNEGSNNNNNTASGKIKAPEFNPKITYGTMTDQDGNVYKTVTIGTQTWMAENLRVTTYNDGTPIHHANDIESWGGLNKGAYCNYNNTNNQDTISTYGRIYNWYAVNTGWYAVNTGILAPKGWHVPSKQEWTTLINYLGGEDVAGGKLKEIGIDHWENPNTGATNESGFTAIPCGCRGYNSDFAKSTSLFVGWWTTDSYYSTAYVMTLNVNSNTAYCGSYSDEHSGYYVRCIKN